MTITKHRPTAATKTKVLVSLAVGIIFFILAALCFALDPLMAIINYYSRIEYGSPIHKALAEERDSIHLSAYLFNITNAEQFLSGEDHKLKVQEVGPFTYQENRTNPDLEIDSADETVRYTPKYKVTFLPEESVGRPEEMQVTMPNVAFLSMGSKVSIQNYFVKMGMNLLATNLDSTAVVHMSAHDYMWGYNEPLIRLGNKFMPGWINFDKLGLLDRLYDNSTPYTFEVSSNPSEKFSIKTVNELGGLKVWGYENPDERSRCNSFKDVYEGIAYPPNMPTSKPIRLYRAILCRFLELDYQGTKAMEYGADARRYTVSNRTFMKLPENECLCQNGICQDGVSDMSPCFCGLPVVLSNAHFLNTDPALYERVEGMTPNEEDHGSEFLVDPVLGMMLSTKFSVQVNVLVRDVRFNSRISRFSDMLVPVMYVKILQPKLYEDQLQTLYDARVKGPYLMVAVRAAFTLVSLLCLSYSASALYWNWIHAKRKGIVLELKAEVRNTKEELLMEPLMKQLDVAMSSPIATARRLQ